MSLNRVLSDYAGAITQEGKDAIEKFHATLKQYDGRYLELDFEDFLRTFIESVRVEDFDCDDCDCPEFE